MLGASPAVDWDGVHVFLRYQSQYRLDYASVNRRDGTAVTKKKRPGGPSNGGTYYTLGAEVAHAVPYGRRQDVCATVENEEDSAVSITASVSRTARSRSSPRGAPPPRAAGGSRRERPRRGSRRG